MEGPGCPAGAVMGGVREPDPKKGPPTAPRPKKKGPPRSPDPSTAGEKPQGQGGGFIHPVCDTDREAGTPLYGEDRFSEMCPRTGNVPGPTLGAADGSGTEGQRGEGDRRERRASGGLHPDPERGEDVESGGEMLEGRESPGRREALKEGSGTEGQRWEGDRGESRDSGGLHQDPERGEDGESGDELLEGRGSPGRREALKEGSGTQGQRWERDRVERRDSGELHQDTERGGEMLEGLASPGRREALKEGSGTEQQSLMPRAGSEGSTQTSPGEKKSRRRTRLPPTGKKEARHLGER
ncbi:hypothetical protein NDU88_004982 [Pleurodeles waltl]|uniref:Uncharacterized protein n=1 Tax=Pleurodeles waltl TaxID=8319 RepID=A0AAV7V6E5_PLEWA|nr:hypothetical protein NDU88_004982 [Pleurodeles waltl]